MNETISPLGEHARERLSSTSFADGIARQIPQAKLTNATARAQRVVLFDINLADRDINQKAKMIAKIAQRRLITTFNPGGSNPI